VELQPQTAYPPAGWLGHCGRVRPEFLGTGIPPLAPTGGKLVAEGRDVKRRRSRQRRLALRPLALLRR
jgi:hypothetical protein